MTDSFLIWLHAELNPTIEPPPTKWPVLVMPLMGDTLAWLAWKREYDALEARYGWRAVGAQYMPQPAQENVPDKRDVLEALGLPTAGGWTDDEFAKLKGSQP